MVRLSDFVKRFYNQSGRGSISQFRNTVGRVNKRTFLHLTLIKVFHFVTVE